MSSTVESAGGGAATRRDRRMDGNFTIGSFGGIEVRLSWSLVVVFALIVWSLTDGVFPSQNPGLSHGTYLAMGFVAAVLFLASILLHELGHSLVARREGIEVDSITLWLFGGVSQFKGRYASPGAEFRVAFTGPFVSIVLGVLFVLIAVAHLPSSVDGVAAWLGYINLILAVFNLLPASPLDGGRVSGEPRGISPGRRGSRRRSGRGSATCSSRSGSRCSSSRAPSAARGSPSSAGSCSRARRQRLATPRRSRHSATRGFVT
jgi:Zn-dependent protease